MTGECIEIYGHKQSPYFQKIAYFFSRLKKNFKFVEVDLIKGQQFHHPLKEKLPFERIPTMNFNGYILAESTSILKYLCLHWKLEQLYSSNIKSQMHQDQWIAYTQMHIGQVITQLVWEQYWAPHFGIKARKEIIALSQSRLERELPILNHHLEKSSYLAGAKETIVDIHFLPFLAHSQLIHYDLKKYKNLHRWFEEQKNHQGWIQLSKAFF